MITYDTLCNKVGVDILLGTEKPYYDKNAYEDKPLQLTPEEEKLVNEVLKLSDAEYDLFKKIRISKDKTLTA